MSDRGRSRQQSRRTTTRRPNRPVDIWQTPGRLPDVEPIRVPENVSTLLRTLGDPPTAGGEILAGYFSAVIERSAATAVALATIADLMAPDDEQ